MVILTDTSTGYRYTRVSGYDVTELEKRLEDEEPEADEGSEEELEEITDDLEDDEDDT